MDTSKSKEQMYASESTPRHSGSHIGSQVASHGEAPHSESGSAARLPFEAPAFRREAKLTDVTAARTFFSTQS